MIMNSQVPEFNELPLNLRFPDIKVEDVCPLLSDIVGLFRLWSPESYEGYYLPCALATVSIISARRVEYLFGSRQAPSMYILLVDTSGMSAKTTVMKLVRAIIKESGLDFLLHSDTVTAQKLFSSMCIQIPQDFDNKDADEKKMIINSIQKKQAFIGQRGWIFDEFGSLIREMMQKSHYNASFCELLKKLYDNRPELSNSTIVRDDEVIQYPYLVLLGGMTPKDLSPHAMKGSKIWTDGFLSRIAFICPPDDFRRDKEFPDGEMKVPKALVKKIRDWHERLGVPQIHLLPEFKVIPAKGQLYNITGDVKCAYYAYRRDMKDQIQNSKELDLAGNYIRYPDMALRIAVLIASLNNDSEVTLTHWGFGQNIAEEWRENLHRLYYKTLPNSNSAMCSFKPDPLERIHDLIRTRGGLTSREIQQLTHFKAATVDVILEELILDGKIKKIPSGKTHRYDEDFDNLDV